MSKKTSEGLLIFVFQDPHDFLMGDTNTGNVYRNYNLVECPKDTGIVNMPLADEHPPDTKIKTR